MRGKVVISGIDALLKKKARAAVFYKAAEYDHDRRTVGRRRFAMGGHAHEDPDGDRIKKENGRKEMDDPKKDPFLPACCADIPVLFADRREEQGIDHNGDRKEDAECAADISSGAAEKKRDEEKEHQSGSDEKYDPQDQYPFFKPVFLLFHDLFRFFFGEKLPDSFRPSYHNTKNGAFQEERKKLR